MRPCDAASMLRRLIIRAAKMSHNPRAKLAFFCGVLHLATDLHDHATETDREREFLADLVRRLKGLTVAQIFDIQEGK